MGANLHNAHLCQAVAMSEQATAGWYPDGHGNDRYWDGLAWTEQLRQAEGANALSAATRVKKEGAFAKVGSAVKKAADDRQAAKDELNRKQADDVQAAGILVTSGVFGTSTVEIYDGGYVRVESGQANATQPKRITKNTPYEKLRSIKLTQPVQDKPSGMTSALEGAVGPAMASLMKGGAGLIKGGAVLMKSSAPGLAVAGLAHLAGAEDRKSFLTIATDKEIHTLTNQSHNGFINKINKGHNEVGLALEAAANFILDANRVESREPEPGPQSLVEPRPVEAIQASTGPTVGERLRELADLHRDGILSDDEFAAVKAKLLSGL
jgi:hypothetical protein